MASATISKFAHLQIPLEDVVKATNNFHDDNIIGSGGFGPIYKGELMRSGKLMNVAVLRLDGKQGQGDVEFWTEVSILSDLKHSNIVSIIGFCDEKNEMIIITTHAAKGSLREHLNSSNLTWTQRLKISVGVARAMSYLHYDEERGYGVIHLNINSSSILLDENWEPKLSGFKVSVKQSLNRTEQVILSEPIGKRGYVDPEIEKTKGVTPKSDVYSFGVVLFELLCGRSAYNKNEANRSLAQLVKYHYGNDTLQDIIHPDLRNQMSPYSLRIYSRIAYACLEKERADRPHILDIVDKLQKALKKALKFQPHFGSNLKIPLVDIKLATDDFSNAYKISSWNDCTLYRAELANFGKENPSSVEGTVVIKRYPSGHKVFTKEAFFTEIEMLSNVKHPNIINLLGFCLEDSEMILVTENVSNGYLFDYLRNVVRLRNFTWEKRLKICIDVAHALSYLHYEMEDQTAIINRHIDCYNIGLDENLGAKIASFCFSVIMPLNQEDEALYPNQEDEALYLNWISRDPYIDPEYKGTRKLKRESDVYSFGIVLFEILCGRSAVDPIYMKESEVGLARVARQCYRSGTIQDIIDPIIKEETSEHSFVLNRGPNTDSLHTFIEIAYKCVAETQDQRPTIKVVVKELEKALFFQNKKLNNPRISLEDIKVATQNFSNCIGGGRFGGVFKGKLQDGNGIKTIVAKRLDTRLGQGEQQFWNELQILLEYKHDNLIGLIGYCDEKDEKLIVYEYAPKGSLDRYLKDASLTWVKRLIICIDVATALYFLHSGVGKQAKVIHRDIKSANILLNHEWRAKLGDFGLSLISPITQKTEYVIDYACGTRGYVDPLYEKSRFLTIESDIYSFGVVLFEILCGRLTFEIQKHKGHYLPDFIKENFQARKHDEVVFEQIRDQIVPESLTTFQEIAFQCLHHEREKRPTTKKVLMELKKALEFQVQMRNANPAAGTSKTDGQEDAEFLVELSKADKIFEMLLENKIKFEARFGAIYKKYPTKPQVLVLKNNYERMLDQKSGWPQPVTYEHDAVGEGIRNIMEESDTCDSGVIATGENKEETNANQTSGVEGDVNTPGEGDADDTDKEQKDGKAVHDGGVHIQEPTSEMKYRGGLETVHEGFDGESIEEHENDSDTNPKPMLGQTGPGGKKKDRSAAEPEMVEAICELLGDPFSEPKEQKNGVVGNKSG